MSALGFKARADLSLACFITWVEWIPHIHLLMVSMAAEPFLIHILADVCTKLLHSWYSNPGSSVRHSSSSRLMYQINFDAFLLLLLNLS